MEESERGGVSEIVWLHEFVKTFLVKSDWGCYQVSLTSSDPFTTSAVKVRRSSTSGRRTRIKLMRQKECVLLYYVAAR